MSKDTLRRFILDRPHIRGEWVHLNQTWQETLTRADYPPVIQNILGEALTAAVLLSATLKHEGALNLQIRGQGPIHLLVVQANAQGTVRGLAHWQEVPQDVSLSAAFGEQAQMAITLETPHNNERYQSLIPLEGESLSAALEAYFARSEQLPTKLWLTSNQDIAAGILLQRLPQEEADADSWQRVTMLLDTLTSAELTQLEAEETLFRLFHEEDVRIFPSKDIQFKCDCSQERIEEMLQSLGEQEVNSILAEQGKIEVTCEFCNAQYQLDSVDAARLFKPNMPPSDTLH